MSKPFDQIVTVDFETYWDSKTFTLSKMTTEEYIRDEKFRDFGACFHVYGSDDPIEWVRGCDIPEYVSRIDWGELHFSRTTHNSMCQYWGGSTAYYPLSSSTPYQWHALYAAWRLAIPSRGWQALLAFPPKGKPYIRLMDYENWMSRSKKNSPSTASTMCSCANVYFQPFELDTLLQNLDS